MKNASEGVLLVKGTIEFIIASMDFAINLVYFPDNGKYVGPYVSFEDQTKIANKILHKSLA